MDYRPLYRLADDCLTDKKRITPEKLWLKEKCEAFYRKSGAGSKNEGDALLFERVFGTAARKKSDVLKIRYWRTGHTVPGNRNILLALGDALELSGPDMIYLVTRYYDRADVVFTPDSKQGTIKEPDGAFRPGLPSATGALYRKRTEYLESLKEEFILKQHPLYLRQMRIAAGETEQSFRHLYYLESLRYTANSRESDGKDTERLASISYGSTLRDMMALKGEILRKNMIRHLMILTAPFVNRRRLDDALKTLGFLPLTEDHHLPGGGKMDALLLGVLELYETACRGRDPEICAAWLKSTLRVLDLYLQENDGQKLRFMQYKSIAKKGRSAE